MGRARRAAGPWVRAMALAAASVLPGLEPAIAGAIAPVQATLPLVLVPRTPERIMFHNSSHLRGLRSPRVLQDDDIPILISQDFAIVATVSVGTPAQNFRCLLDSGSADLWLPSKRCESCSNEQYFDADASSTFSPKLVRTVFGDAPEKVWLQFASGPVAGFAVQDSIGFGPFQMSDHSFMLVEDANIPRHPDWDGICGLGWRGIAQTGEPLYKKLQEMGQQAIFTFVPSSTTQASLVVGEVPTALAKDDTFVWSPLEQFDGEDDQAFWIVRGGVSPWNPAPKNVSIVVDTGTNGILMVPAEEFPQLVEHLIPPEANLGGQFTAVHMAQSGRALMFRNVPHVRRLKERTMSVKVEWH
ncbi:unnamed protein product [Prorocentrum cordatum]|uniref:Peptidase A1 domain-containing protein n=1 Tax=Prorocentrum cordatum TaxID=2364126 RepID=A0ABN9QCC0_9DINO|nr:unnamed protein product [Polarella glacialis]